jgi:chromosomal replication initiation ATPase DnaA
MLAASATPLLMTAATLPRDWGLTLPDLASRVQSAPLTRLEAPDDALLAAVLVKLFADRQITVPPALIAYLIPRMERSFDAARAMVAELDAAALARGSPVTRSLAATLLDNS